MPVQNSDKAYSNFQLERMVNQLGSFLKRADVIGYVAARNYRVIDQHLTEYYQKKNQLIFELGENDLDENGNETGNYSIKVGSHEFDLFNEKIGPIGSMKLYPDLFLLLPEECVDKLTGEEMLQLDWMIYYDEDGGDNS